MKHATGQDLADAFERAARALRSGEPAPSHPLVEAALGVLAARRAGKEAEPCPTPVLRRVQGFFALRPRGSVGAWLRKVFDTGKSPAPAMRGASARPRTLRYRGEGATVDLQVRPGGAGSRTLHVALRPPRPDVRMRVRIGKKTRSLGLDADGTGSLPLSSGPRRAQVSFHVPGGVALRIGAVPLD